MKESEAMRLMAIVAAYYGGQRLPLETSKAWASELLDYDAPTVMTAIRQMARTRTRPSLDALLAEVELARTPKPEAFVLLPSTSSAPQPTPEHRRRQPIAAKIVALRMQLLIEEEVARAQEAILGAGGTQQDAQEAARLLRPGLIRDWTDERCRALYRQWIDVDERELSDEAAKLEAALRRVTLPGNIRNATSRLRRPHDHHEEKETDEGEGEGESTRAKRKAV